MVQEIKTYPCGCQYEDDGKIVVRVKECDYHRKRRTRKRPYRAKAESVKP